MNAVNPKSPKKARKGVYTWYGLLKLYKVNRFIERNKLSSLHY